MKILMNTALMIGLLSSEPTIGSALHYFTVQHVFDDVATCERLVEQARDRFAAFTKLDAVTAQCHLVETEMAEGAAIVFAFEDDRDINFSTRDVAVLPQQSIQTIVEKQIIELRYNQEQGKVESKLARVGVIVTQHVDVIHASLSECEAELNQQPNEQDPYEIDLLRYCRPAAMGETNPWRWVTIKLHDHGGMPEPQSPESP